MEKPFLIIAGIFLILFGFAMILVTFLQTVMPFETFPYAIVVISGACLLNSELFGIHKSKIQITALLSFIFGLASFIILGTAAPLGILGNPLILIFSLSSLVLGIIFMKIRIANRRKGEVLKGAKLAMTGVFFAISVLMPYFITTFIYNPHSRCEHARAYYLRGDYDRAIEEYNKAMKIEPMLEVYYERGLAYFRKGDHDQAIADFTREIESFNLRTNYSDSTKADIYYNRALAYFYKHNFGQAWKDVYQIEALGGSVNEGFITDL